MGAAESRQEPTGLTRAEEAAGTYIQAIAHYWPVVVCAVLLTVATTLLSVVRGGETYEASASILVSPLTSAELTFTGTGVVTDTGDPARTVQTAAALLSSPRAAAAAAESMGDGWDGPRVQAAVSVTPRGQSNVLAVTARAPSAGEASQLANAYAASALANRNTIVQQNVAAKLRALNASLARRRGGASMTAERQELAVRIVQLETVRATGRDPTLQIAQEAELPTGPEGLPDWLLVALSALVGFAIGSVGAVALAYFGQPARSRVGGGEWNTRAEPAAGHVHLAQGDQNPLGAPRVEERRKRPAAGGSD